MFNFDTVIDTYVKQSNVVLASVQPEQLRKSLSDVVDLQATVARNAVDYSKNATELFTKNFTELAKTADFNKFFAR